MIGGIIERRVGIELDSFKAHVSDPAAPVYNAHFTHNPLTGLTVLMSSKF